MKNNKYLSNPKKGDKVKVAFLGKEWRDLHSKYLKGTVIGFCDGGFPIVKVRKFGTVVFTKTNLFGEYNMIKCL